MEEIQIKERLIKDAAKSLVLRFPTINNLEQCKKIMQDTESSEKKQAIKNVLDKIRKISEEYTKISAKKTIGLFNEGCMEAQTELEKQQNKQQADNTMQQGSEDSEPEL